MRLKKCSEVYPSPFQVIVLFTKLYFKYLSEKIIPDVNRKLEKLHLERSYKKPETAKLTLGKAESNFLEHFTSFATTTPNFEQHLDSLSSYNFRLLQQENC